MTAAQAIVTGIVLLLLALLAGVVWDDPQPELRTEVFMGATATSGLSFLTAGLAKLLVR